VPLLLLNPISSRLSSQIPLSKALKEWEAKSGTPAAEAKEIMLYGGLTTENSKRIFIKQLDGVINTLKECERLALSTNQIDRLVPLAGMEKLRLLSIGRNQIRKFEGLSVSRRYQFRRLGIAASLRRLIASLRPFVLLQDVAGTLEELWASYNFISSLDGLQACTKLQVLYMANNTIKDWAELDKLKDLPELREVLFVGNPIYDGLDKTAAKMQVIKRLPKVAKIDNEMVIDAERVQAGVL
jgi:dynein light chain 1, axonemal